MDTTETAAAKIDATTAEQPTIEQLTVEVKFYLGQLAQNIIEVGKRLIQAKALLPHGEWQNWLENNFQLTVRTARRFMQIADRFGKTVDGDRFQASQLTELLALPEDETEQFIEAKAAQGTPVEDMTVKNLRAEIADWKRRDEENQQKIAVYADELSATQIQLADTKDAMRTVSDENCGLKRELAAAQQNAQNARLELQNRPVEIEVPADYHDVKNAIAVKDAEIAKKDAQISSLQEQVQIDAERLNSQLDADNYAALAHNFHSCVQTAYQLIHNPLFAKFLADYKAKDQLHFGSDISTFKVFLQRLNTHTDDQK